MKNNDLLLYGAGAFAIYYFFIKPKVQAAPVAVQPGMQPGGIPQPASAALIPANAGTSIITMLQKAFGPSSASTGITNLNQQITQQQQADQTQMINQVNQNAVNQLFPVNPAIAVPSGNAVPFTLNNPFSGGSASSSIFNPVSNNFKLPYTPYIDPSTLSTNSSVDSSQMIPVDNTGPFTSDTQYLDQNSIIMGIMHEYLND